MLYFKAAAVLQYNDLRINNSGFNIKMVNNEPLMYYYIRIYLIQGKRIKC